MVNYHVQSNENAVGLLHVTWINFLFWSFSCFSTEFSQTVVSFDTDYSCTSSHGCFPVKLPNYFIVEAPSNKQLKFPFKVCTVPNLLSEGYLPVLLLDRKTITLQIVTQSHFSCVWSSLIMTDECLTTAVSVYKQEKVSDVKHNTSHMFSIFQRTQ